MDSAFEVAGLADRAADRVDPFSGGMKRRLNLGCGALALARDPAAGRADASEWIRRAATKFSPAWRNSSARENPASTHATIWKRRERLSIEHRHHRPLPAR